MNVMEIFKVTDPKQLGGIDKLIRQNGTMDHYSTTAIAYSGTLGHGIIR